MSNKTWKRLLIGIFIICIIFAGGGTFYYFHSIKDEITGEEYLKKQAVHVDELETYADNMDNVVALYLNGNIEEQDFINHLDVFQQELSLMKASYQQEKQEHPVKVGSHTYATKKGSEAIEECYEIFGKILSMMKETYPDKEVFSYQYIAYHQDIIGALADYMTAVEQEESE